MISNVLLTSDIAGGRHPVTLQKIITLRGFAGAAVAFAGASDSIRRISSGETAGGFESSARASPSQPDVIAKIRSLEASWSIFIRMEWSALLSFVLGKFGKQGSALSLQLCRGWLWAFNH